MNDDQNEIFSQRAKNLNELGPERQFLFNDADEDSEVEFNQEPLETDRVADVKEMKNVVRGLRSFRRYWDHVSVVLTVYSCIVIPFYIAFYVLDDPVLVIIDTLVDCFFVADMAINFFTTYIDKKGKEVFAHRKIRKNYLHRRFLIDIFCTFPIDKILLYDLKNYHFLISAISLLKIFRLRRISLISKKREQIRFRLVQVLLNLILVIHFTGCLWYLIAKKYETWIPFQDIESKGTTLYSESVFGKYITCYYQALWLILGQEILPSNKLETWTASIAIALGTVVTSYLLGEILMITTRMSLKYDIHVKALDHSLSVMGKMEISGELRRKILDYVTRTHPTLSSQEEFESLCHYISPVLQRQVFEYIYRPIFTSNPLFDGDYKLAKFIISRVSYNFYQPEQEIIVEGTRANDFYFLVKGNCSVFVRGNDGKKHRVCSLAEGNHFGEIGLIYRTYRTATVMSMAYSTAAHLGKNEFRALTSAFPYLVDKLKQGVLQYRDPWKLFVLEIFNQLEAFEHLPLEVFEEIIYKMKVIKVLKGEYLFKTGEPMKGMIAVTNGLLEMSMLLNDSKCALIRSLSYHSIHDTENQEGEKLLLSISVNAGQKIKAEVIPVMTEETDEDVNKMHKGPKQEVEITQLRQGTLLYANMVLKKVKFHKLQCKALENSTIYLLDCETIRNLIKQYPDFCKKTQVRFEDNYLDFFNAGGIRNHIRYLWKKAIFMVIMKNRKARENQKEGFKEMMNKLKAVIACQKMNNLKLAEDVMQGVISYKFITKDGMLDPAVMYPGALPYSHPVMKKFEDSLGENLKNTILSHCNKLESEINAQVPKIKMCKQRLLNSHGLIDTLLEQLQGK